MRIGVLALQGDFEKHQVMLDKIDVESLQVKYPHDLQKCSGLIIPGGESTTLTRQLDYSELRGPIIEFAGTHSVFGTCAGMIMLADEVDDNRVNPLGLIHVSVTRNGWGRQVHSSTEEIHVTVFQESSMQATFIRAPGVTGVRNGVQVLAEHDHLPVFVREGHHIATSFHPELGEDTRIHEYFRDMIYV